MRARRSFSKLMVRGTVCILVPADPSRIYADFLMKYIVIGMFVGLLPGGKVR